MKSLAQFLSTNLGRLFRAIIGILLAFLAMLVFGGYLKIVFLFISMLLFFGAVLDICCLAFITNKNIKGSKIRGSKDNKNDINTTILLLIIGVISTLTIFTISKYDNTKIISQTNESTTSSVASPPESIDSESSYKNIKNQEQLLLYLIEEEKLAHDVYTVMYQYYGAKVFGNILKSEETHQDKVLSLLQARGIKDPRSNELGVFNNTELQKLYNDLISQGKQSELDAYKVGVIIEEKDIADITKQLSTATEEDIVSILEALRNGSENHLRAFNRQIGKY